MSKISKKVSGSSVPVVDIVRNQPIAQFLYKGSHSKPVRRTVIITGTDRSKVSGYEVREGRKTRVIGEAFKSYNRSDIRDMKRFSLNEVDSF